MLRCVVLSCLIASTLVGCGASKLPLLGRVNGTVLYNGKPLEAGTIVLSPVKGRPAEGAIRAGRIVDVSTFGPNDGAPVGFLAVAIQDAPPKGMDQKPAAIVPSKYNSRKTSDLVVGVFPKSQNNITIELTD